MWYNISKLFKQEEAKEGYVVTPLSISLVLPNHDNDNNSISFPKRNLTIKTCECGSNTSLSRRRIVLNTLNWHGVQWHPKNNELIKLQGFLTTTFLRVNQVHRRVEGILTKGEREVMVNWTELPDELWAEIGKRLSSRLDFVRFGSVCKLWRSFLPSPRRFPLWVPPPPDSMYPFLPHFLIEHSFYVVDLGSDTNLDDQQILVMLTEFDQGARFYSRALVPFGVDFNLPKVSSTCSRDKLSRLSFVAKTYELRMANPLFDSPTKRVKRKWHCGYSPFVGKTVVISSNDGMDVTYAPMSSLSLVTHFTEGTLKGRLALLRLEGSSDNRKWDTDFCDLVFESIAVYQGRLFAVERMGRAFVMDYNSLKMTQVATPLPNIGPSETKRMLLFEARGDLYLITPSQVEVVVSNAKIYKIDLQLRKWIEVEGLGNQVLVMGRGFDFSIPRDVLDRTYGFRSMKCKGKKRNPLKPSMFLTHSHDVDDDHNKVEGYCVLGFATRHYIPWQLPKRRNIAWPRLPSHDPPTMVTTPIMSSALPVATPTSSILAQYDESILGLSDVRSLYPLSRQYHF